MSMKKLVLFDAFATLIKPRAPIAEQYASVFRPHFSFDESLVKPSFKNALKHMQSANPAYVHSLGADGWWAEVMRRTAVNAGAEPKAVESSLPTVVPALMKRFSSREGYELYDDVLPTLKALRRRRIPVGVVSNSDARVRLVLRDLDIEKYLSTCILSEEEGIEKPDPEIWRRAIRSARKSVQGTGISDKEDELVDGKGEVRMMGVWHVGDELDVDYHGARRAGHRALLIRRPGALGEYERKEDNENVDPVRVIRSLEWVVDEVL